MPRMRRALLTMAVAGVLTGVGAVAAPALSTHPYMPPPVDFKLKPTGRAVQEVGGEQVSRPIAAPKRFDIVGLRWTGGNARTHVELRVRRRGGGWSRWADATVEPDHAPDPGRGEPAPHGVSAPVWADGADQVQYRASGRLRGVELKFVNTTGTATAADRAETALREAANKGVTGVAGLFTATAVSQPTMITRSQWGADDHCRPRQPSERDVVKAVFVHPTVNANSYSRSDARSMVLGICRYHRDTNGWDDIGYNFLVDKYGQIFEGRNGG